MYFYNMNDWKQINTLLEKINHLHLNLKAGHGPVSRLERDLMLDYLKAVYEAVAEVSVHSEPIEHHTSPLNHVDKTPQVILAPVKPTPAEPAPKVEEVLPEPVKLHPAPEPIKEMQITPPAHEAIEMISPTPVTVKTAVPTTPTFSEPSASQLAPAVPAETKTSANGMTGIFEAPKTNDLSDRLGDAPISDLNRALGFNEKYLICNQLFGGDFNVFYQIMQQLNQFNQFSQAQQLLSPLAHKHNWVDDEKKEQAQTFIKLVRRRYKSANS